ncbi:MAG: insulinase family protein [Gammaproteobacteria bacterium]|nr:insulinase family protein [Gammaproteobacteria bacterium]
MYKQILGWLMMLLPVLANAAVDDFVHAYTLKNGLKLLIKEDHRAPVVVSQIWYKVGSAYEHGGITGVSHMLEHMMFKGTEHFGPGQFSRLIAENGGQDNAFTSHDYTAYFQILEKSRLAVSFELEADRMRNLMLANPKYSEKSATEFAKELEVVKEERRMRTEDNPHALTQEYFNSVAFSNSSYKNPIIGWKPDLDTLTVEDLRNWYVRWYAPNNATLVVVGDVQPQEVYALAEKYFGPLSAQTIPPVKPRVEVEQLGVRQIHVRAPAQVPYLLMGYKVPVLKTVSKDNDWEPYALEVLSGILGGSRTSRFERKLVREQRIAAAADVDYDMQAWQADLLVIDATPASGKSVQELQQAVEAQIEALKTEPVNSDELDRIKAQVVAHDVYQKDSSFYQGMELGIYETVGLGYKRAAEYVRRIRQVTPEQIQQVARKYLVTEHLTIAILDPQPMTAPVRPHPPLVSEHHH